MTDLKSSAAGQKVVEWAQVMKSIITKPKQFFHEMPLNEPFITPLKFYAMVSAVNTLFVFLLGLGNPIGAFKSAVFTFVFMIAMSFVSTGITLWLSRAFGGKGNFESTYSAVAYASAPNVIGWLPFVGFFAGLYSLYLLKLGLERAQELDGKRAIFVIAIEIGIYIVIGLIVALAGLSKVMQQANTI